MPKTRDIFLFLAFLTSWDARGQSLQTEAITVAHGLSQGFVTALHQDRMGFLWIGTLDGLNRYDGYTIRRFLTRPFDPYALTVSAEIHCLFEDKDGLLWVGTKESLYIFDPATEHFFNLGRQFPEWLQGNIQSIIYDETGCILVLANTAKHPTSLLRIRQPAKLPEQLRRSKTPLAGLAAEPVRLPPAFNPPLSLKSCVGDSLLLVTDNADRIFRLPGAARELTPFDPLQIQDADPAEHNILWSGKLGYLFRQRLPDGSDALLKPCNYWPQVTRLNDGDRIVPARLDSTIFKITAKGPIGSPFFLHPAPDALFWQEFQPVAKFPFALNVILADASDIIWAGTTGYGLRKINLKRLAFHNYAPQHSLFNLREMPDGRIWPGKLFWNYLLNLSSGELEKAPWATRFSRKEVYNLLPDRAGNIWFVEEGRRSGQAGSIVLWEKSTNTYRTIVQEALPLADYVAEQLIETANGNIWVAAHAGRLFRIRPGSNAVDHFNCADIFSQSEKDLVSMALSEDMQGNLWLGTNRGLVQITNARGDFPVFTLYQHNPDNHFSLSLNAILSICPDPTDPTLLWIGTRGGGLDCLDKTSGFFSHYTETNGLPDNVVYGILPDDEGKLWCSTNRGLACFSPRSKSFINYLETDGLQSAEFNTGAYLCNRQGALLFGGVNGLTLFHPRDIRQNNRPPTVVLTALKVQGNLLNTAEAGSPLQFAPSFPQTLTLPFSQNNVMFEFAALDFTNPATNRYRYRLLGADRDWVYSGTVRLANYANLSPGQYTFEVQGATADSDWNPEPAVFHLHILPPWHRSWLAYVLYLLTASFLAWRYIRLRENRLREKHEFALEHQESERLKELHAFKNKLFANITHEFRTPLTIILGLAERMRRNDQANNLPTHTENIIAQGRNLLDLVNQMLDLAKLDSQALSLQPVQDNLSAFVRHQAEAFRPLASYKEIELHVKTDLPDIVMDFDPQRFRQMITNLLSNALRHTPPGGSISIDLKKHGDQQVRLVVSDTGEGISEKDLPHIFDRFYQGTASKILQSTGGIGLALTRELVLLAGGQIEVQSAPGKGAMFSLSFPVHNDAPLANENRNLTNPDTGVPPLRETHLTHLPLLLVIEDNPVVADYLHLCLDGHFRMEFAASGEIGVQKALDLIPDLILSDVMMPGKDGLEVIQILKNDLRTSHIPIILLSAKTQLDDRLEGYRRGANAYLTKPFNDRELLLVLQSQMEFQQRLKQRYASSSSGIPPAFPPPDKAVQTPEVFQKEDDFMKKVYGIFEKHYADEEFDLEQLCRLLGMSSSQLHRKLAALTDRPAIQMLRIYRLKKAYDLLLNRPDLNVTEVCFMVGFKNINHFSRMFSRMFGVPPSKVSAKP